MSTQLYGIKTCDTVRKAQRWLTAQGHSFEFVDLRAQPIELEQLKRWCDTLGWQKVLNKRSTTWKGLSAEEQQAVVDAESACALLQRNPTMIKRPVLEYNGELRVGFSEPEYLALLTP